MKNEIAMGKAKIHIDVVEAELFNESLWRFYLKQVDTPRYRGALIGLVPCVSSIKSRSNRRRTSSRPRWRMAYSRAFAPNARRRAGEAASSPTAGSKKDCGYGQGA